MMLFERLGCPEAASRFALAATKQACGVVAAGRLVGCAGRGRAGRGGRLAAVVAAACTFSCHGASWLARHGQGHSRGDLPPAMPPPPQVPAALPLPDQSVARQQRLGRLWANVFAHAIEDGEYEVRGG